MMEMQKALHLVVLMDVMTENWLDYQLAASLVEHLVVQWVTLTAYLTAAWMDNQ